MVSESSLATKEVLVVREIIVITKMENGKIVVVRDGSENFPIPIYHLS